MSKDICVIGGGLAGLYIASTLKRDGKSFVLLETAVKCGGRIRSVYAKDGSGLLYEAGPWRIPATHTRVRDMFAKYDIELHPAKTQAPPMPFNQSTQGLSIWESNAVCAQDPRVADRKDLETGYANETDAAAGSSPYMTADNVYYVAPQGFSALVDRLVKDVGEHITTGAGVTDIRREKKGYHIKYLLRGADGRITHAEMQAKTLFVCVPPSSCATWTIFRAFARAQMAAVKPSCLNHVYVRARQRWRFHHNSASSPLGQSVGDRYKASHLQTSYSSGRRLANIWHNICVSNPLQYLQRWQFHHKSASSLLGQSVGDQYEAGYFQASYSSGRLARMWYNIRLSNPLQYVRVLRDRMKAELEIESNEIEGNVHSHFWENAFHMWVPTPSFQMDRLVRLCVTPNLTCLPSVFLAGEAFSSFQAWMEGALETAELALQAYSQGKEVQQRICTSDIPCEDTRRVQDWVVVEGRILDMSAWKHVHPGSTTAIDNHAKEDVTDLMKLINHSQSAWAQVLSLQVGWAAANTVSYDEAH
jgi:hypothetical protein